MAQVNRKFRFEDERGLEIVVLPLCEFCDGITDCEAVTVGRKNVKVCVKCRQTMCKLFGNPLDALKQLQEMWGNQQGQLQPQNEKILDRGNWMGRGIEISKFMPDEGLRFEINRLVPVDETYQRLDWPLVTNAPTYPIFTNSVPNTAGTYTTGIFSASNATVPVEAKLWK